jgi:prepilin-type N-terminal cleavage/methylation domain-containing protein
MKVRRASTHRRLGLALIELVVAILIIALLAAAGYGLWRRGSGKDDKSIPAKAIDKAQSVECQNMLQQVRAGLQMAQMDSDGQFPASIPSDVAAYAKCPDSGQPYTYDAQSGTVSCSTPGHERY